MTNKASNQQDEIWTVIAKGLVEAVKMVFSIFLFVFTAGKSRDSTENIEKKMALANYVTAIVVMDTM